MTAAPIPYRVCSLAPAEQPIAWADRNAVALGTGSFERVPSANPSAGASPAVPDVAPWTGKARRASIPLAGREMSAEFWFLPQLPGAHPASFVGRAGVFLKDQPLSHSPITRASGDPAPVRPTGFLDVSSRTNSAARLNGRAALFRQGPLMGQASFNVIIVTDGCRHV
jgi:hypothetical protein